MQVEMIYSMKSKPAALKRSSADEIRCYIEILKSVTSRTANLLTLILDTGKKIFDGLILAEGEL
jgi:hypothetical protein